MARTLTSAQQEELRRKLEDERRRILGVVSAPVPSPAADQEIEFEESAQRETELTHRMDVDGREQALLAEVERALAKLASGRYGTSEKTGEPIPYERLAAVPWARDAVGD